MVQFLTETSVKEKNFTLTEVQLHLALSILTLLHVIQDWEIQHLLPEQVCT